MAIDVSRVRAICFDVDGTLNNTDDQLVKGIVRILTPLNFIFKNRDTSAFARRITMYSEGPSNWFYGFADKMSFDDKVTQVFDFFYDLRLTKTTEPFDLMPGIHEMLDELRKRYSLSIVSARGEKSTMRFLFQYQLAPYFTAIATGQTTVHTKPYPDPILWAADKMGVPPSSCIMIGDTVVDILAGKQAGAQTVGVLCGFGEETELIRTGAETILKETTDLLSLLKTSVAVQNAADKSPGDELPLGL